MRALPDTKELVYNQVNQSMIQLHEDNFSTFHTSTFEKPTCQIVLSI